MSESGSDKVSQRKLYKLAVQLFKLFEHSADERGYLPWRKLSDKYNILYKTQFLLRHYGLKKIQQLPDILPMLSIRGNNFYLSEKKLVEFLLTSALRDGKVSKKQFPRVFTEATGLDVDTVFTISRTSDFNGLCEYLCEEPDSLSISVETTGTNKLLVPKQKALPTTQSRSTDQPVPTAAAQLTHHPVATAHPNSMHSAQSVSANQTVLSAQPISTHKPTHTVQPVSTHQPLPDSRHQNLLSAQPMSTNQTAQPMSTNQAAQPMSTNQTAQRMSTNQTAQPMSTNQTAQPMSTNQSTATHKLMPTAQSLNTVQPVGTRRPLLANQNMSMHQQMRTANPMRMHQHPMRMHQHPISMHQQLRATHPINFHQPVPRAQVMGAHPSLRHSLPQSPSSTSGTTDFPLECCEELRVTRSPSNYGPQPSPSQPAQPEPKQQPYANPQQEIFLPSHPFFQPQIISPRCNEVSSGVSFIGKRGASLPKDEAVKKINDTLDSMIDELASKGKFVPESAVRKLLDALLNQARRYGYIQMKDIPVWSKYSMIHGRISELIKVFCWMSPITTLYELERALISVEDVTQFEDLRIGPLIKHPHAVKFFQPPSELQEVPEVSAYQIQLTLLKFLDKHRRRENRENKEKTSLTEFMEFFGKSLSKPSPEHLCVRITSFPLAIQTNGRFRRMQRVSHQNVDQQIEAEAKTIIDHHTEQLKQKLLSRHNRDPHSTQYQVAVKNPMVLFAEIFGIFEQFMSGMIDAQVRGFLQLLMKQKWINQMFLLAIYEGAYGAEKLIDGMREDSKTVTSAGERVEEILHQSPGEVRKVLHKQLTCQPFPIELPSLARIEQAIAEHFGASLFHKLTGAPFLQFLTSDSGCLQAMGGSLTIGASQGSAAVRRQAMAIVCQLTQENRDNKETVSEALKLQFGVGSVSELCCGSTEKLIGDATQQNSQAAQPRGTTYLTPLIVNGAKSKDAYEQWSSPQLGVLGHQTAEDALQCLLQAPLLEDLACWSHWSLIYQPHLGDLGEFLQRKEVSEKIHALRVGPYKLLKVDSESSHQKFCEAVERRDAVGSAGQLVSIVAQQGSVHEVAVQLMASHVQAALEKMVPVGSTVEMEGGGEEVEREEGDIQPTILVGGAKDSGDTISDTSKFIFDCLLRIPYQICHFIANEIFIEPLRKVVNKAAVDGLLSLCRRREERRFLQALGMSIGIKSWADDFRVMLREGGDRRDVKPVLEHSKSNEISSSTVSAPIVHTTLKHSSHDPSATSPHPSDEDLLNPTPLSSDDTQSPRDQHCIDEDLCKTIVDSIRKEEFGIGLKLEGKQKEIADRQRLREGRGLQRLSKELYSKDSHFVLELVQNADDNSYSLSSGSAQEEEAVPALKFVVEQPRISVLNNEVGFREKNVRAICDVGKSTKGAHRSGYIGQKGIGFKSVFRVTDLPEIHSNGFHIRFDAQSDAIGYILPHWVEQEDRQAALVGKGWRTTIILPLKKGQQPAAMARKFQDIQPSLLLFLRRLRSIAVEDKLSDSVRYMRRSDHAGGITRIQHSAGHDQWLVVRRELNNAQQFKLNVEVTEVALAFPLPPDMQNIPLAKNLDHQQVFAYLPLRSYGFRFIVQGDFDLPSSREDVNSDSAWNQWIRSEIPRLFVEAAERMKELPGLSTTDAVAMFLQFVPLDGELHDFFKPVSSQILSLLRASDCLPTQPSSEETTSHPFSLIQKLSEDGDMNSQLSVHWKRPSQLLMVREAFILKNLPQDLLTCTLNQFYLSSTLRSAINSSLQTQLGIQSLSIDHLVIIAETVKKSFLNVQNREISWDNSDSEDFFSLDEESEEEEERSSQGGDRDPRAIYVEWVALWLVCVHLVLEEEKDRTLSTIDKLKNVKVIPLANGAIVSAQDFNIFFPTEGGSASSTDLKALFDELRVVDPRLFNYKANGEVDMVAHRIKSVLQLMGVKEMLPMEIIKHHILPCFQKDQWKTKSPRLLCTYLVYIKDCMESKGSGVTEGEMVSLLKDCVVIVTKKHGILQPCKDVVHLSSQYKPKYDLEKMFPDVGWKLVSPDYLANITAKDAILSWREFLIKLAVKSKLHVMKFTEQVEENTKRWEELRPFVGRSPDGAYTLHDFESHEFEEIVQSIKFDVSSPQHQREQMVYLATLLDKLWDEEYRKFSFAQCYDGANEALLEAKKVPSSFHRQLTELKWLPAVQDSRTAGRTGGSGVVLYKGQDLFENSKANMHLLDFHVPYVGVELKNSNFLELLRIKCGVDAEDMVHFLLKWSKESFTSGIPFEACIAHIAEVYLFLYRKMDSDQRQDHFASNNIIFVPNEYSSSAHPTTPVAGQFLSIHDVCWMDPTTVLYNKQKHNRRLTSTMPRVLHLYYENCNRLPDLNSAFKSFGVAEHPKSVSLIECLKSISNLSPFPDRHHVNDFTSIVLYLSEMCMEGKIPPEFIQKQLETCKVFPSHRNQWVSLDSCLLENDDQKLAKCFSECKEVHFLQWPAPVTSKPQHPTIPTFQRHSDIQRVKEEQQNYFTQILHIKKLSNVVKSEVEPGSEVKPLPELKKKLHVMIPLIQRYLLANDPELYLDLQRRNTKRKMEKLFVGSVKSLACTYLISQGSQEFISPVKSSPGCHFRDCNSEDDFPYLYVEESKIGNSNSLVPALLKMFHQNSDSFKSLIKDLLLASEEEMEEDVLTNSDYIFGDVTEDDKWVIPLPVNPKLEPEESSSDSEEDKFEEEMVMPKHDREEKGDDYENAKSWPPRAPISVEHSGRHPSQPPPKGSSVSDAIGDDDLRKLTEKHFNSQETAPDTKSETSSNLASPTTALQKPLHSNAPRKSSLVETTENNTPFSSSDITPSDMHPRQVDQHSGNSSTVPSNQHTTMRSNEPQSFPQSSVSNHTDSSNKPKPKYDREWQAHQAPEELLKNTTIDITAAMKPVAFVSELVPFLEDYSQLSLKRIGTWGEEYVYQYLNHFRQLPDGQSIHSVTWVNQEAETGAPYDIEVTLDPEQEPIYIEVKCTPSAEKELVAISWNELKFAETHQKFHLFRVYSGGSSNATLKWLENLGAVLDKFRLFIHL